MELNNICPTQTIVLAKQGEYGQTYTYDFSRWVEEFGEGSVGWVIQRSADFNAYPLVHTEDGYVSSITLTETETAYSGRGVLVVFYINEGETEKRISNMIPFYIEPTLMNTDEAPSAWESYIDAVHRDAEKVSNLSMTAEIDVLPNDAYVTVEKEETDTSLALNLIFHGLIPDVTYNEDTGILTITYASIA